MKMWKGVCIAVFALIIVVTPLSATTGRTETKPITLTAVCYVSETQYTSRAFTWWLDHIEKETGGRLLFKKYYGGALISGPNTVMSLGKGLADFGMIAAGYVPGMLPLIQVGHLPFLTGGDTYAYTRAMNDLFRTTPEVQNEFKKANLHWLSVESTAPGYLCALKPVRKVEDLKNLKIRAYGYTTKALELLQAAPVTIAYGETFSALQTGVVDGALGSSGDVYSQKWYEVAKNLVDAGIGHYIVCAWCFNPNSWKKLPDDIKRIIERDVHLLTEKEVEFAEEQAVEWLKKAKGIGCELHVFSGGEKEKAAESVVNPIIDMWVNEMPEIKGVRQEVIKRYRSSLAEHKGKGKPFNPFSEFMRQ